MSADDTTTCQCGHASDWHEIEPPYSCMTCECMAFRLYVRPSPSADRARVEAVRATLERLARDADTAAVGCNACGRQVWQQTAADLRQAAEWLGSAR